MAVRFFFFNDICWCKYSLCYWKLMGYYWPNYPKGNTLLNVEKSQRWFFIFHLKLTFIKIHSLSQYTYWLDTRLDKFFCVGENNMSLSLNKESFYILCMNTYMDQWTSFHIISYNFISVLTDFPTPVLYLLFCIPFSFWPMYF